MHRGWAVGVMLLAGLCSDPAPAAEGDSRIPATVIKVIDGDSLTVKAKIWIGQTVETVVWVNGIDAPELKGKCAGERVAARAARAYVLELLDGKRTVVLYNVKKDKYGGRVNAGVLLPDGRDLGETMVQSGHARAYQGGKRQSWCKGEAK